KHIMKVQIISPGEKDPMLAKVLRIVEDTARKAGLKDIPQAGYYVSTEINAFASGPSKSNALIAVSTGLLNAMNDAQLEGVIGHEIAHIKEGDMVTMTVMQGAVNAEILFLSYLICHNLGIKSENAQIGIHLFEVSFGICGIMAINAFSRRREFRADEGSARLYGKDKIISALKVLQKNSGNTDFDQHTSLAPFKISGNTTAFRRLLATHPPIEERIKRLENLPENEKSETEIKPEIADSHEQSNNVPQTSAVPANDSEKISKDIPTEKIDTSAENKTDNLQGAANNTTATKTVETDEKILPISESIENDSKNSKSNTNK
ncbi:MAG: M48 family metalloprotease, partial [Elusimicrobiales bacterium]|nr:M48 family metalloprotease [Elusimicrobiales bacterium]